MSRIQMPQHEVVVSSPPDRIAVVAELWFDGEMWGELRYEGPDFLLELYPSTTGEPWLFDGDDALQALSRAKRRLQESE